jgi:hypothetical protein
MVIKGHEAAQKAIKQSAQPAAGELQPGMQMASLMVGLAKTLDASATKTLKCDQH